MPGVSAGTKRKDPPTKNSKKEESDDDSDSSEEEVVAKKAAPVKAAAKPPVKAAPPKKVSGRYCAIRNLLHLGGIEALPYVRSNIMHTEKNSDTELLESAARKLLTCRAWVPKP